MMTSSDVVVTGGVDTHGATHHAAALDQRGRVLGDREFPATDGGYRSLLAWLAGFGPVAAVGVEGTGSYGAGLSKHLRSQAVAVVEVNRPDRASRRLAGKSDPLDAIAAARAVQSGAAAGQPKAQDGPVEAIRVLMAARDGAVKARTGALNQLRSLLVTAPEALRGRLEPLKPAELVARCARLRPDPGSPADPDAATRIALRAVAKRIRHLDAEIAEADRILAPLVAATAPRTVALFGVGAITAATLLVAAGDNPDRLRSEAAFARLCGAAPIPASSGLTQRHRLSRGGNRQANSALYMITMTRLCHDSETRAYAQRRTGEGKSKKEIIRCLKRYLAREIHHTILADLTDPPTPTNQDPRPH